MEAACWHSSITPSRMAAYLQDQLDHQRSRRVDWRSLVLRDSYHKLIRWSAIARAPPTSHYPFNWSRCLYAAWCSLVVAVRSLHSSRYLWMGARRCPSLLSDSISILLWSPWFFHSRKVCRPNWCHLIQTYSFTSVSPTNSSLYRCIHQWYSVLCWGVGLAISWFYCLV